MKKTVLFFLFSLFIFSGIAQRTYSDIPPDSVKIWVDQRVANAKKGIIETVRIPFVVRSMGWGCMCPMHFIGTDPNTQDGPWISPILTGDFPETDENGNSFTVTGYFTGEWTTEDYRNEDGEPEGYLYKIPNFIITSWKVDETGETPAPRILKTEGKKADKKRKKTNLKKDASAPKKQP